MKVIICGAGQVGWQIARHLAGENNKVTIVDIDADLIRQATDTLDVTGVVGFASHPEVLDRAGARDAWFLVPRGSLGSPRPLGPRWFLVPRWFLLALWLPHQRQSPRPSRDLLPRWSRVPRRFRRPWQWSPLPRQVRTRGLRSPRDPPRRHRSRRRPSKPPSPGRPA